MHPFPSRTTVLRRTAVAGLAAGSCLTLAVAPASAVVSVYVGGTQVSLSSDGAGDTISLSCVAGQARHDGSDLMGCSTLTYLTLSGGDGVDTLDVSAVTAADFPSLTLVRLSADDGIGADTVRGSQVTDEIAADYQDTVSANGGDDQVEGGAAVTLGAGDDVATGTSGSVDGGPGDDRIEQISSGPVIGGPGIDTVFLDFSALGGEISADFVLTADNLHLRAETPPSPPAEGDISVAAVERYEMVLPKSGTQSVDGRAFPGELDLQGKSGVDVLRGGVGDDFLDGGAGADQISGGPGFDYVQGGPDNDTIDVRDGAVDRAVCGDGTDTVVADPADLLVGCENVQLPTVAAAPAAPAATETGAVAGPRKVVRGKRAAFTFTSPTAGAGFQCRVDTAAWKSCRSPYKLATRSLKPGRHTLQVRAVSGSPDPTPAVRAFKVVAR